VLFCVVFVLFFLLFVFLFACFYVTCLLVKPLMIYLMTAVIILSDLSMPMVYGDGEEAADIEEGISDPTPIEHIDEHSHKFSSIPCILPMAEDGEEAADNAEGMSDPMPIERVDEHSHKFSSAPCISRKKGSAPLLKSVRASVPLLRSIRAFDYGSYDPYLCALNSRKRSISAADAPPVCVGEGDLLRIAWLECICRRLESHVGVFLSILRSERGREVAEFLFGRLYSEVLDKENEGSFREALLVRANVLERRIRQWLSKPMVFQLDRKELVRKTLHLPVIDPKHNDRMWGFYLTSGYSTNSEVVILGSHNRRLYNIEFVSRYWRSRVAKKSVVVVGHVRDRKSTVEPNSKVLYVRKTTTRERMFFYYLGMLTDGRCLLWKSGKHSITMRAADSSCLVGNAEILSTLLKERNLKEKIHKRKDEEFLHDLKLSEPDLKMIREGLNHLSQDDIQLLDIAFCTLDETRSDVVLKVLSGTASDATRTELMDMITLATTRRGSIQLALRIHEMVTAVAETMPIMPKAYRIVQCCEAILNTLNATLIRVYHERHLGGFSSSIWSFLCSYGALHTPSLMITPLMMRSCPYCPAGKLVLRTEASKQWFECTKKCLLGKHLRFCYHHKPCCGRCRCYSFPRDGCWYMCDLFSAKNGRAASNPPAFQHRFVYMWWMLCEVGLIFDVAKLIVEMVWEMESKSAKILLPVRK